MNKILEEGDLIVLQHIQCAPVSYIVKSIPSEYKDFPPKLVLVPIGGGKSILLSHLKNATKP